MAASMRCLVGLALLTASVLCKNITDCSEEQFFKRFASKTKQIPLKNSFVSSSFSLIGKEAVALVVDQDGRPVVAASKLGKGLIATYGSPSLFNTSGVGKKLLQHILFQAGKGKPLPKLRVLAQGPSLSASVAKLGVAKAASSQFLTLKDASMEELVLSLSSVDVVVLSDTYAPPADGSANPPFASLLGCSDAYNSPDCGKLEVLRDFVRSGKAAILVGANARGWASYGAQLSEFPPNLLTQPAGLSWNTDLSPVLTASLPPFPCSRWRVSLAAAHALLSQSRNRTDADAANSSSTNSSSVDGSGDGSGDGMVDAVAERLSDSVSMADAEAAPPPLPGPALRPAALATITRAVQRARPGLPLLASLLSVAESRCAITAADFNSSAAALAPASAAAPSTALLTACVQLLSALRASAPPAAVTAAADAQWFPGSGDGVKWDGRKRSVLFQTTKPGLQSTGLYVPAGGTVKLSVSEDMAALGLSAVVGAHTDDLTVSAPAPWKRFPLPLTATRPLSRPVTTLTSAHGGLLFLHIPLRPFPALLRRQRAAGTGDGKALTVAAMVSGAADAPRFRLGYTRALRWVAKTKRADAPWGEVEGDEAVLVAPTAVLRRVEFPHNLALFWDGAVRTLYDSTGTVPFPRKQRIVLDYQLSVGWSHSGYPVVLTLPQTLPDIATANATTIDRLIAAGNLTASPSSASALPSAVTALRLRLLLRSGAFSAVHALAHNQLSRCPWLAFPGANEVLANALTCAVYRRMLPQAPLPRCSRRLSGPPSLPWLSLSAPERLPFFTEYAAVFGWPALRTALRAAARSPAADAARAAADAAADPAAAAKTKAAAPQGHGKGGAPLTNTANTANATANATATATGGSPASVSSVSAGASRAGALLVAMSTAAGRGMSRYFTAWGIPVAPASVAATAHLLPWLPSALLPPTPEGCGYKAARFRVCHYALPPAIRSQCIACLSAACSTDPAAKPDQLAPNTTTTAAATAAEATAAAAAAADKKARLERQCVLLCDNGRVANRDGVCINAPAAPSASAAAGPPLDAEAEEVAATAADDGSDGQEPDPVLGPTGGVNLHTTAVPTGGAAATASATGATSVAAGSATATGVATGSATGTATGTATGAATGAGTMDEAAPASALAAAAAGSKERDPDMGLYFTSQHSVAAAAAAAAAAKSSAPQGEGEGEGLSGAVPALSPAAAAAAGSKLPTKSQRTNSGGGSSGGGGGAVVIAPGDYHGRGGDSDAAGTQEILAGDGSGDGDGGWAPPTTAKAAPPALPGFPDREEAAVADTQAAARKLKAQQARSSGGGKEGGGKGKVAQSATGATGGAAAAASATGGARRGRAVQHAGQEQAALMAA